jgi:hypothetical protein
MSVKIGLQERKNAETRSAAGQVDVPMRGYGTATGSTVDSGAAGPALGGD